MYCIICVCTKNIYLLCLKNKCKQQKLFNKFRPVRISEYKKKNDNIIVVNWVNGTFKFLALLNSLSNCLQISFNSVDATRGIILLGVNECCRNKNENAKLSCYALIDVRTGLGKYISSLTGLWLHFLWSTFCSHLSRVKWHLIHLEAIL